jgi:hypothetical protein
MYLVENCRLEIYDYFHMNAKCQKFFSDDANEDSYAAYYNSMYLLQDSTESLLRHRELGFNSDPLLAYLEFWGVMQAVIIQQDSIAELYQIIIEKILDAKKLELDAWFKIRNLRNVCSGHPAKKGIPNRFPLSRTFMGRKFGNYEAITYEQWQQGEGRSYFKINLAEIIDSYAVEAAAQLTDVLSAMRIRWQ